ncbi:MAG: bifunctional riboflavin kinase/FAD synthetase [Bryobacteraceae bacterium]
MPDLRIYRGLDQTPKDFGPCALTIGNFDGVHVGHRAILRRVAEISKANGWRPSVLTFDPHPASVVAPERAPKLLTAIEQRFSMMAEEGIGQVLVLPFTAELARLTPEEFVMRILVERLRVRAILVGDNFRFGNRQGGDTRLLGELGRKYGFTTEVIPAVKLRNRIVSSSEVRRLLGQGDVAKAGRLLGRCYALEGPVVRGRGIGAKQTAPTLNLDPEAGVVPATGVYVTRTEDAQGRRWPSVTNVGYRPTFNGDSLTVETFLLSPIEGASPEWIRVEFLYRLREERKFAGPEELKAQILRDAGRARSYFRRRESAGAGRTAGGEVRQQDMQV